MSEFIGSKVAIPGTRGNGILRYYGTIEGKNGVFGGIELIGPIAASRGKNSGSVDGIQYFEVERPMTGLFLPIERLKTVNPQLAKLGGSRESSGGSLRYNRAEITPSPIQRRNQISRPSSSKGSPFSSPYPIKSSQVLNIPKRQKAFDATERSAQNPTSMGGSDVHQIKMQLTDYKNKYEKSIKEMAEKSAILNDLRLTVNQIQPILEEYEIEIADKEKRLAKQKTDFERAREEWRESLNLMATTQQENETYYEAQIEELNSKLKAVNNKTGSNDVSNEEYTLLTKNFEALSQDMENLKREFHSTITEKDKEIKRLVEGQERYKSDRQDSSIDDKINENEILKDKVKVLEKELRDSKKELNNTRADLDRVERENEDRALISGIQSVSITNNSDELNQKVSQLQCELDAKKNLDKQISDLKHELEMRPTFDELTELQVAISEIESIHSQEIQSKQEKLQKLQSDNTRLKEKIDKHLKAEVETKNSSNDITSKNVESEVEALSSNSNGDSLPIYRPNNAVDPGNGKDDWCGLCERDGHNSINCPYEIDMF